jgi:hypothetical protein
MPGFSGQGKVLIGLRKSDGSPDLLRWLGNASRFVLALEEDTVERRESYSGQRLPQRRMTRSRNGNITITFDEFSKESMAYALLGATTAVSAGSAVTNWVAPTGATVDSVIALPHKNVSAVTVRDSTGSPKTLPAGQYELDAFAGTITLKDITTGGAYVQPFKVDYTPGANTVIGAFKNPSTELYIRMDGVNVDDGSRVVCDVFRSRLTPTREFSLINDDYNDFELQGSVLADLLRSAGSAGGQFFSLTLA